MHLHYPTHRARGMNNDTRTYSLHKNAPMHLREPVFRLKIAIFPWPGRRTSPLTPSLGVPSHVLPSRSPQPRSPTAKFEWRYSMQSNSPQQGSVDACLALQVHTVPQHPLSYVSKKIAELCVDNNGRSQWG